MLQIFKIIQALFFGMILAISSPVFAANHVSNFLAEQKDLQFTLIYPAVENKIELKVTIPKNFKTLGSAPNAELLEFTQKTDQEPLYNTRYY